MTIHSELSTKTAEKSSKILKTAEIGNIIPTSDTVRKNHFFWNAFTIRKTTNIWIPKIQDQWYSS